MSLLRCSLTAKPNANAVLRFAIVIDCTSAFRLKRTAWCCCALLRPIGPNAILVTMSATECVICKESVVGDSDEVLSALRCAQAFHSDCLQTYATGCGVPLNAVQCPTCRSTPAAMLEKDARSLLDLHVVSSLCKRGSL